MATILAIESSCDETAAAIIQNGKLLSNIVSTQIDVHRKYGGVMPEIASRLHAENISVVLQECLEQANITLDEIDAVSNEIEIDNSVGGGCGKGGQFPLPISCGGPYVRIKKINVQ